MKRVNALFWGAPHAHAHQNKALLMRHAYILKRRSGLAREKARVEGFAGKPAPTVNSRCVSLVARMPIRGRYRHRHTPPRIALRFIRATLLPLAGRGQPRKSGLCVSP